MNLCDLAVNYQDSLIFRRRRPSAIDHPRMSQRDDWRFDADELLAIGLRSLGEGTDERRKD